jgi:CRISPR system Cascade subunit CasB
MLTEPSSTKIWPIDRVLARVAERPDALATLRRGVGRDLEESPASWPYVMEVAGDGRWREDAAHVVLGLFALHHQAQIPGSMNRPGLGLGSACRQLKHSRASRGTSAEGVERRFKAALAAETPDALSVHLRGLVTLLRGAGVGLDYPRLYWDLCRWQFPAERGQVCLRWGREYFRTLSNSDSEEMTP